MTRISISTSATFEFRSHAHALPWTSEVASDKNRPMPITNLTDESAIYKEKRAALLEAEIALAEQRERVADLRRSLPQGPQVADYVFEEGPVTLDDGDAPHEIQLSQLFSDPKEKGAETKPLVIYHLMYGKQQTSPCPMCTCWIDGFNGLARHLGENVDFAIVAAAPLSTLRSYGRQRGWNNLRLLSAHDTTFKYDLGSEDATGVQDSEVSVFIKDASGRIFHTYSAHPWFNDDLRERGIDLLNPLWHVLDLTPHGRGDWYASLTYT
jgi:predicted dithiol-disulfide oxidoreductase (DUF899 family)